MKYKIEMEKRGALVSPVVKEEQSELRGQKFINRAKINQEVFDTEDAIADNAKMISLMFSTIIRMYETFTDTQKGRLSAEDKALMEYTFAKFQETQTRADLQLSQEGTDLIDKILTRQQKVTDIIKDLNA